MSEHQTSSLLQCILEPTAAASRRNAWVIRAGDDFVIVDPGHPTQARSLLTTLDEAGLKARRCTHVLLTDVSLNTCGNAALFKNAMVASALENPSPAAMVQAVHARQQQDDAWYTPFLNLPEAPQSWSLPSAESDWTDASSYAHLVHLPLPHAPVVSTVAGEFTAIAGPGVSDAAMVWMADDGTLFGGETCNLDVEPEVRNMDAYLETLLQVTRLTPRRICPASGVIHRSPPHAFRSLSLFANNLMSNIQYALDGPRTVPELRYRDQGYWPEQIHEFAAACRTLESALHALHAAGVATREMDDTGFARYFIDRPARY